MNFTPFEASFIGNMPQSSRPEVTRMEAYKGGSRSYSSHHYSTYDVR